MSINNAILGILSYKSLSGYDLKKVIQESPFMHWSGNNNQIYKALVELLDEGYVTNEVCHQESSPSKKIYTITKEGRAALKTWVLSTPEPPEYKKTFLIQLAWAGELNTEELDSIITNYENEVRMQVIMQQENKRRAAFLPDRNSKDIYLWEMIYENIISSYKVELSWIQELRKKLSVNIEETNRMNYKVIEKNNKKYIELASAETPLLTEQNALDVMAACYENETYLVILHSDALTDDFFKLRTGLAGQLLQKFANYRIKVAIVIAADKKINGKFKELQAELSKGNELRTFNSLAEAENWLVA